MPWFKREKQSIDQIRRPPKPAVCAPKGYGPSAPDAGPSSGKRISKPIGKCVPSAATISAWARGGGWNSCSMMGHGPNMTRNWLRPTRWSFPIPAPIATGLRQAQAKYRMADAIITAQGRLDGREDHLLLHGIWVHRRLDGRGGGRKSHPGHRARHGASQPLVIVSCSGGARMMEGTVSLMQLAKVAAALARLDEARQSRSFPCSPIPPPAASPPASRCWAT